MVVQGQLNPIAPYPIHTHTHTHTNTHTRAPVFCQVFQQQTPDWASQMYMTAALCGPHLRRDPRSTSMKSTRGVPQPGRGLHCSCRACAAADPRALLRGQAARKHACMVACVRVYGSLCVSVCIWLCARVWLRGHGCMRVHVRGL